MKAAKRPTTANQMISELSALLRYSLNAPMTPVTVREEIEATKSYIHLQSLRLGEQFQVTWEYSPKVLEETILRLLLQPIIENSISHCAHSRTEDLKIRIRIYIRRGFLTITVIDNGLGMSADRLHTLQHNISDDRVEETGRHIGLKNISQRVRLSYPDGYVKLWSREGMGTIVIIGGIPLSPA